MQNLDKFVLVNNIDGYAAWQDSPKYQNSKRTIQLPNGDSLEVQLIKKERYQRTALKICLAIIFTLGTVFIGLRNQAIWDLWTGREVKRFKLIINNKTLVTEKARLETEIARLEVEKGRLERVEADLRKANQDKDSLHAASIGQKEIEIADLRGQLQQAQDARNLGIQKIAQQVQALGAKERELAQLKDDTDALREDFQKQRAIREEWWQKQIAKLVAKSVDHLSQSGSDHAGLEDSLSGSVHFERSLLEQSVNLEASLRGAPMLNPPQQAQPAQTWIELAAKCAQLGMGYIVPVYNAAYDVLIDRGASWKEERYQYYSARLKEHLGSFLEKMNPREQDALRAFADARHQSGREEYHQFHSALRSLLRSEEPRSIALSEFCQAWFAHTIIVDNLVKNVFFLSEEGYKISNPGSELAVDLQGQSLHDKMELIFRALDKTPSKFLAPSSHLLAAKFWKLTKHFDPLAHTNMPWTYCRQIYKKGDKVKKIVNMRTGVPIGPAAKDDPKAIEGVAVVPEYLSFLSSLQKDKKKLVVFLHLDPSSIYRKDDELFTGWNKSPLKMNEATWTRVVLGVEKDFPDTVEVNVLPFDGKWKHHKSFAHAGGSVNDFKTWLLKLVTEENSPFIFSQKLRGSVNLTHFIDAVLNSVHNNYFAGDYPELTAENKKAFYGFFLTHLQEAIQLHQEADIVQNNCVDGIDRTGEIMGSKLAVNFARMGQMDDEESHKKFIGCVTGPALAIWKRPILKDRREIFMSVLEHLQRHQIQPSKDYDGWTLDRFLM